MFKNHIDAFEKRCTSKVFPPNLINHIGLFAMKWVSIKAPLFKILQELNSRHEMHHRAKFVTCILSLQALLAKISDNTVLSQTH
jgi:hypothetical protein